MKKYCVLGCHVYLITKHDWLSKGLLFSCLLFIRLFWKYGEQNRAGSYSGICCFYSNQLFFIIMCSHLSTPPFFHLLIRIDGITSENFCPSSRQANTFEWLQIKNACTECSSHSASCAQTIIKVCPQHFSLCQPCSLFVLPPFRSHFHSCALTSASVPTDCLVLISHQGLDEKARAPLYCVSADKLSSPIYCVVWKL